MADQRLNRTSSHPPELSPYTQDLSNIDSSTSKVMLPRRYTKDSALRIVVLLAPPPVQLLDLAPIDLFHMLRSDYLSGISTIPGPTKAIGLARIEIVYVADVEPVTLTAGSGRTTDLLRDVARANLQFAPLTANVQLGIDKNITDPEVQPGQVSILFIPGPIPNSGPSEACQQFIQAHAASGTTDIITVCTGIYPACVSGICDGKIVTGPRGSLTDLRQRFPNVKAFEDRRWSVDTLPTIARSRPTSQSISPSPALARANIPATIDTEAPPPTPDRQNPPPIATDSKLRPLAAGERPAELWTAGGITNGHDAVAAFIRAHFDNGLAEAVLQLADTGERRRDYGSEPTKENVRSVGTKLKTALRGILPGNGRKRGNGTA